VAEVIDTRLTACNEPALEDCQVVGVQPISGVRVLLVSLSPQALDPSFDAHQAAEAAARATGFFRTEVAAALHRKHAPQLRFVVVPAARQGGA
jgi:ribosome-binding factor A